jgi:hypothetical protein
METINNKIPEETKQILNKLSEYLDTKLYFFGSIQRADYYHYKSDIDIDIFTDNINTTLFKLQSFFNINKKEFNKVILRIGFNNRVIYGYKLNIKLPNYQLKTEICIWNDKYKNEIIQAHKSKVYLTSFQSIMVYLLKLSYYYFYLFDKKTYSYLKKKIIDPNKDDDFIVFHND